MYLSPAPRQSVLSNAGRHVAALGVALTLAACGSNTTTPTTPAPAAPTVTSVTVGGATSLPAVGLTAQLTAAASLSDGTTQTVTNTAGWQSSNAAVATVSATGLVTAVTYGTATITATFQGATGTSTLVVSLDLTGTWSGTGTDSSGSQSFTSIVMQQSGTSVTGVVTATLSDGRIYVGSFNGSVATANGQAAVGFQIGVSVQIGAQANCDTLLNGVGQVTSLTFTGGYQGQMFGDFGCPNGQVGTGQLTLTRHP